MIKNLPNLKQVLAALLTIAALATGQTAWAWDGSGTSDSPWLIKTTGDLVALANNSASDTYYGKFFRLENDLDMNGVAIGTIGGNIKRFRGTFDGNGHAIRNLTINKPDDNYVALFGIINANSTIRNLIIDGANITGNNNVGVIFGCTFDGGTIENCLVVNSSVTVTSSTGTYGGIISGCYLDNLTFSGNYYRGCTVINSDNPNGTSIGIGVGTDTGSQDQDGARSVHKLTLGTNITATGESVVIDGTTYYASNTTITLGYSGTVPAGQMPVYSVGGTAIEGNTFTMPAANRTVSVTFAAAWSGSGTSGSPYVITTTAQLDALASAVKGGTTYSGTYFVLGNDIAYSTVGIGDTDENFIPIGGYFDGSDRNFSGTFNGQNHTISGIRLYKNGTAAPSMNQGLFGRIDGATIENVVLADAHITGYRYVGGLVGNKVSGTVQNCLVLESTITCENTYVGALFGKNTGTITANYYHNCTVNGTANATNVGVGGNGGTSSSSDKNGARSAHTLTLGENVTATGESVTYQGTTYYASNTQITLGYNNLPAGYTLTYTLNGTALSGNTFTMPANDNATVNASTALITYNITYDLDGGSVATANPATYNVTTPTFTLTNPTKVACNFDGWTGSNGNTPETTVTIAQGSTGDRSYTAQWTQYAYPLSLGTDITASGTVAFTYEGTDYFTPGTIITLAYGGTIPEGQHLVFKVNGNAIKGNTFEMPAADVVVDAVLLELERYYIYNSTTGELALLWGEFNKDNKWGSEVTATAVTSVTATDEVSFTGDCSELFSNFTNCTSMDLTDVNTANVTNMSHMFYRCRSLQSLDLSGWNTANVTDMYQMFQQCSSLQSLSLSGWNTANVTDMKYMFRGCSGLQSLNISGWNTANVTDMSWMFQQCSSLQSLDLTGWNTSNVEDMSGMFRSCSGLQSLDLTGWNTSNVEDMSGMFYGCSGLTTIYAGEGWNTYNVWYMSDMFEYCTSLVGGMGTTYDAYHTDGEYARIDRGPNSDQPGYFTGRFTKEIAGYEDNESGWYLIASPLAADIAPTAVTNMTNETFDLYYFDQTGGNNGKEWKNWKNEGGDGYHFNLEAGKGYLYANSEDVTLVFTGTPFEGDGSVTLTYETTNADQNMWGWNLVGNPFSTNATIGDTPFYRMNAAGSEIIAADVNDNTVNPMEGIFVKATQANQTVTFETAMTRDNANSNSAALVMDISQNRGGVIDRAIVRFDEGQTLPKFQIHENSTKIYIPQDGTDYAVAVIASDSEAIQPTEHPIHFKAAENGTYTLTVSTTFNSQLSTVNYLHLIDNMTGADVDLLASDGGDARPCVSTYTFTAKTTDYASRFKLVFSVGVPADGDNEAFAFIDASGNIIITGVGDACNASIQMVDMMGRVLVCRDALNASLSLSTAGMAPGVYVLRLINGENVRTQKIVIE